jgi:hypothetical protein
MILIMKSRAEFLDFWMLLDVDLGKSLFERIHKASKSTQTKENLPHPCLIFAILKEEGVDVPTSSQIIKAAILVPTKKTLERAIMDLPWNRDVTDAIGVFEGVRLRTEVSYYGFLKD